jgi:hypothetical protein
MNVWLEMLNSKKFRASVIGVIVAVLIGVVPPLEPLQEHLTEILGVIAAYVLGQGLADFGKEQTK